jgi:hypothetical protein
MTQGQGIESGHTTIQPDDPVFFTWGHEVIAERRAPRDDV